MSEYITIEQGRDHIGETVTLKGWLYNRRSSGKLHFLQIRDGSGFIQAVMYKPDVSPELFEAADKIPHESSVVITGEIREDKRSPIGYEIGVTDLRVVSEAGDEYPITKKEHGVDFLTVSYTHLRAHET